MRSASPDTPDCSASTRVASWSADISRLKKATFGAHILLGRDAVILVAAKALGGVVCDIGRERGLAHARTSREDHQVTIMHAADLGVHAADARGNTRQVAARVERAFGRLQRGEARLIEALDRSHLGLTARDAVKRGFGFPRSVPADRRARWCRAHCRRANARRRPTHAAARGRKSAVQSRARRSGLAPLPVSCAR